jgi:hypothetical protein
MCSTGSFTSRCAAQYEVSHKLESSQTNYFKNVFYPMGIMNVQTCLDFETQNETDFVYIGCQQLWHQICW